MGIFSSNTKKQKKKKNNGLSLHANLQNLQNLTNIHLCSNTFILPSCSFGFFPLFFLTPFGHRSVWPIALYRKKTRFSLCVILLRVQKRMLHTLNYFILWVKEMILLSIYISLFSIIEKSTHSVLKYNYFSPTFSYRPLSLSITILIPNISSWNSRSSLTNY